MELKKLEKKSNVEWLILPHSEMKVPATIYASETLIQSMDNKVYEQICNVASLPGIVNMAYAMPDAHWGYGFPIGGVAAFDPDINGVVSAGGVGFDISCGVRLLTTGIKYNEIEKNKEVLAEILFSQIPVGMGSKGGISIKPSDLEEILTTGAIWAIKNGYGYMDDLAFIEEKGCMSGAIPEFISEKAKQRQLNAMGTLGSGNHYVEVQEVTKIFNKKISTVWDLHENDVVISIHCGSRGLGHQIGTEYLRSMVVASSQFNINLPDRELACAPINSELGTRYLGAMRGAINCAFANRQIITHIIRDTFNRIYPISKVKLLYDVSHNTCKEEYHQIGHSKQRLFVHRKGATRAFGPGHAELPAFFKETGQPVIVGGSMGTKSFLLSGTNSAANKSFSSAAHGAGRAVSRHEANKRWKGKDIIQDLNQKNILIRSNSYRGIAEEAPLAYKDIEEVVNATQAAQLADKVVELSPRICIKG